MEPLPPTPPPPKKRRRWPWIVLITLSVLGIVVVVAFPPVASAVTDRKIRDYVASHYSGRAEFDSVSVEWSGEAVVENLRLIPADGRDLATIRRVYVDVAVWEFIGGQRDYVIELDGVTASVRKNPDGTTNLDAFLVSPIQHPVTPLPPTRLDLTISNASVDVDGKKVELTRATYKTADLNAPGALTAELVVAPGGRIAVTGDVSLASNNAVAIAGSVKTLIDSLPLAPFDARVAAGRLGGSVTLDIATRDAIADLTLRDLALTDGTRVPALEVKGGMKALTVTTGKSVKVDVSVGDRIGFKAVADVAELVEMLREPLKIKEGVALTGSFAAEGSYASGTVTGWLRLLDVKTSDGVEIEKDARIDVDAAFADDVVDVRKLDVRSSAVTATASGRISGTELAGATLDATADLNLLDAKLSAFMDIDLAGTLKARITSEGQRVTLDADAAGFKAAGLAAPIDVSIDGTAVVAKEGSTIESLTVRSAPIDLTASGRYAESLDLAWKATVRPDPLSLAIGQPMSGPPFDADGRLAGPIDALVAELRTSIAQITHKQYQVTNANIEARARADGTIEMINIGSDALNLQSSLKDGVLEGTYSFHPPALGKWLGRDLPGETARGTVRRTADAITGTLACPQLDKLHDLTADFDVTLGEGGAVTVRRAHLQAKEGVFDVSGSLPSPLAVKGSGAMGVFGDAYGGTWTCDLTVREDGPTLYFEGTETIADLVVVHDGRRVEDKRVTIVQKARYTAQKLYFDEMSVDSEMLKGGVGGHISFEYDPPYLFGLGLDVKYVPDKLGVVLARFAPGVMEGPTEQMFRGRISGQLGADRGLVSLLRHALGRPERDVSLYGTFDSYTLFGFKTSGVAQAAPLADGTLSFSLPMKANGGTIVSGMALNPSTNHLLFTINEMKDVAVNRDVTELIRRMHPVFDGVSGEMTGTASGNASITYSGALPIVGDLQQAAIAHLYGSGAMHIVNLKLKGSPFLDSVQSFLGLDPKDEQGEFYVPEFVMRDGYLAYDAMRIRLNGLTMAFSGRVYYDQRLHLEMVIPVSEEAGRANAKLAGLVGVPLRVPISGTISEPKFGWDEAILNALKDKGKSELEKKIKDLFDF